MSNLNVFAIGASRNIGYFAALRLLAKGATVTFLLRSPDAFKDNAEMQKYIESGQALIVPGDALKPDDVRRGWETAQAVSATAQVNLLLFTVGGTPSFHLLKGAVISPPDLCTQSLLNVLRTMPESLRETPTKIIAVTSTGATRESHKNLPLPWKPFYSWLLPMPHEDKLGMELVLSRCLGEKWEDRQPSEDVIHSGWEEEAGTPAVGSLKHVLIVRPAFLTDGECKGDLGLKKAPYRCGEDSELGRHNGYTISRKDVAHFIVEEAVPNWSRWEGKRANVGY